MACFGRSYRLQKLFCTDLTEHAFSSVERDVHEVFMEYGEFSVAFQLQFRIYGAESERFRWEKENHHLNEWFSR